MKIDLKIITLVSAILVFSSLFLKENLNSIFIAGFCVLILMLIVKNKDYRGLMNTLVKSLPLLIYYCLVVVGIIINHESKVDYLVRLIPFLVGPLFIYYFQKHPEARMFVLKTFVISNILFLVFLDGLAILDMMVSKSIFVISNGREYYRFLYTRYTDGYFNHIYLSTYCLFSTILLLQFKIVRNKMIKAFLVLYLLFHVGILGSRSVVISIILGSFIYLIILCILNKKNLKYLFIMSGILVILSSLVYSYRNTLLLNRYSQAFEWYKRKNIILERNYSINNRVKLYIIGTSIFKEMGMYGINGTGIAEMTIKEKYNSDFANDFELKTETYNTHNQYINNFIDWGLIGLMLTLYMLYMPLAVNFKNKLNWIALFWLCFIIVLSMETALIRQRGIIFFVLFYSLFILQNNSKKNA